MNAFVKIFNYIFTISKIQTQLFIEYELEPVLVPEFIVRQISKRVTPDAYEIPGWAIAYSFFEREYIEIEEERIYIGKRKNCTRQYKIGKDTLERVEDQVPSN